VTGVQTCALPISASSQNVEGESVGWLNQFFSFAYHLRVQGKKLKASYRRLYYVSKWVAILGALWLIFW
jgi:beta-hydroxylase